jgi:RNA polymerase primary sigma factor
MYDIVSKEYKADVSRSQPLTSKAEKVATPDQLVRANLRFVIKCALSQSGRGVPLDELVQAGNLGLVIASRRFNPSQGFRFITFAVHWVRRYIFMCIEKQSGIMAYPLQVQKDARRLYRLISKRESDGLPPPSDGEAASELGVTLGRIHNCRNYMARYASLDALQSRVNESDNNKYGE